MEDIKIKGKLLDAIEADLIALNVYAKPTVGLPEKDMPRLPPLALALDRLLATDHESPARARLQEWIQKYKLHGD